MLEEVIEQIANYLGFRHFFRHGYAYFVEWAKLEQLVISMRPLWAQVKSELQQFMTDLNARRS